MSARVAGPSSVGGFVVPTLLFVGVATELVAENTTVPVVRIRAGEAPPDIGCAAAVFDLRAAPVSELEAMRAEGPLASVPLLLVSDAEIPDAAVELLRADDACIVASHDVRCLRRRLRVLVELGRARLAASFAEQALERSVTALSVVDLDRHDEPLVHVSPVFERLTGFSEAEVLGRNCRFLQRGDRDQPAIDTLKDAVERRAHATAVVRNYRKDGSLFWNEVTVFPLLANGRATRWMAGVQHDVTALAEAQSAIESLYRMLVDQRRFDHAILDGMEVGIVTTDEQGIVSFANRAAAQLLQTDPDVAGIPVEEVLGLEKGPTALLGGETRRSLAYALATREGTELDLELTVSRGDEGGDARVGYFFIFRDVRDEKKREAERRRFERLAAMGTMVAGFAHEVRNPVAAMRSIAEELAEELRDAGISMPHVGLLLQMVERIERLVKTSLQFGRPAAPKRSPQRPWVIVSSAIAELRPRLRKLEGEITIEVEPDLPDVNVDERQIAQALVVLLNNALDATSAASRVLMRVRRTRLSDDENRRTKSDPPTVPSVRFEVIDDGPGIPSSILGRIFDPFFTTKPTGTGLGLSIAQQIVSENGARIDVESTPGISTAFIITVPT